MLKVMKTIEVDRRKVDEPLPKWLRRATDKIGRGTAETPKAKVSK